MLEQLSSKEAETLEAAEILERLETSTDGLTDDEAKRRLDSFGPNTIEEKQVSALRKLLAGFWGPIPWMIEAAVVLSIVAQHWTDFAIISVLLLANVIVGFWEEHQAGNAIAALKANLAPEARLRRKGTWSIAPASELVPGDIIRLRLGDVVPADAYLLGHDTVEVDQSALTGESLPVERGAGQTIYSGSILDRGETDAVVYATGGKTYFGKTAELVGSAKNTSHFEKAVLRIGNYLIMIAAALVSLIIAVAISRGDAVLTTLQFALVLTVAAIPVALPTVLSVTMSVGARILAAKDVIVSKLTAIEELAGMDVLCSDKTGTLTKNELTVGDPALLDGVEAPEVLRAAALASRAEDEDAIDLAVLERLDGAGQSNGAHVVDFRPFDPVSKRTEARVEDSDHSYRVSKGAPQAILGLLPEGEDVETEVDRVVEDFASRGFRSLGVARTDDHDQWHYLGVLPLYDPPRDDSAQTVATAEDMGVQVKMITGDQLAIGREVSREVGLGDHLLDAEVFEHEDDEDASDLADTVEQSDGFAQVFPEHKFEIVSALQEHGHFTGMTGDGVNDAPALKKADIGIAVSGATDAARAAADIVLLTPGLSVIIDAIKESRRIFQRMNSYATYRIAETIRVLLFMTLSILVFNFYPVTAVMIVLLALLNDGAILSIATDRVHYSSRPEAWDMRSTLGIATLLGVAGVIASFGLFYLGVRAFGLGRDTLQTLMYLKLSVAGQLTIFLTRTRGPFWSSRPSGTLLVAVAVAQTIATLVSVYGLFMTPIGWSLALLVWGYAIAWFLVNDRLKLLMLRRLARASDGTENATQESAG